MKKFRSYSFWVSLTSAILILLQSIAKIFGFEIENDLIENFIMSICGVLVVFGIVVAPNKTEKGNEVTEYKDCDIVEDKENIENE